MLHRLRTCLSAWKVTPHALSASRIGCVLIKLCCAILETAVDQKFRGGRNGCRLFSLSVEERQPA